MITHIDSCFIIYSKIFDFAIAFVAISHCNFLVDPLRL